MRSVLYRIFHKKDLPVFFVVDKGYVQKQQIADINVIADVIESIRFSSYRQFFNKDFVNVFLKLVVSSPFAL